MQAQIVRIAVRKAVLWKYQISGRPLFFKFFVFMFSKEIFTSSVTRRAFIATSASAILLPAFGSEGSAQQTTPLTVQQVIDIIIKSVPGAPFQNTVDTLKAGKADTPVTSIISTMFATTAVIKTAINIKANFIIVHEPTFYNHPDDTTWLKEDKVFNYKMDLLKKNNIAVWRFHDYWHAVRPDGVLMGVLKSLGWLSYYNQNNPNVINVPSLSLGDIIKLAKEKLGIAHLRVIGDLNQPCKKIALMPGAAGGKRQMELLQKESPDVLLVGESPEWETIEYMRDATESGLKQGLIVLGHSVSEEPGMEWLVSWLQPKVSGIPVVHVSSQDPFTWI
jgi:putative NIF3 family GTP cyclohydrolase 1 type 2